MTDLIMDFDTVLIDDKWYLIQIVYENEKAILYINAEKVKEIYKGEIKNEK